MRIIISDQHDEGANAIVTTKQLQEIIDKLRHWGADVERTTVDKPMIKHTFKYKDTEKTMSLSPTKAIRQKCIECSCWNDKEVRDCPCTDCALYPFRMGKAHYSKKVKQL